MFSPGANKTLKVLLEANFSLKISFIDPLKMASRDRITSQILHTNFYRIK